MHNAPIQKPRSALQFKCASCGGAARWAPDVGGLGCDHCGSVEAIHSDRESVEKRPLALADTDSTSEPKLEGRRLSCKNCGAIVDLTAGEMSSRCAFCDSSTVACVDGLDSVPRPDGVLPCLVPRAAAIQAFDRWLDALWFRPNDLRKRARVDEISGVYVPFWAFSARIRSTWSAHVGTRVGDSTNWRKESGERADHYHNVLIYGAKGLPPELNSQVVPERGAAPVSYRPEYVAGFSAEFPSKPLESAWPEGEERLRELERAACRREARGDQVLKLKVDTEISDVEVCRILVPLWICAFRYADQPYRFLVNGVNGLVKGQAPYSKTKIALAIGLPLAAVVPFVLLALMLL